MTACPTCGETERISGTPVPGHIQITCGSCNTTWLRGDSRCKGCGATGGIPHRQVMTRTPRGNQVAVVEHREVVVCPACDAAAITAAASAPVPQDYVSVFLFGVVAPITRAAQPARARPRPAPQEPKRPRASASSTHRGGPRQAPPRPPPPLRSPNPRRAKRSRHTSPRTPVLTLLTCSCWGVISVRADACESSTTLPSNSGFASGSTRPGAHGTRVVSTPFAPHSWVP